MWLIWFRYNKSDINFKLVDYRFISAEMTSQYFKSNKAVAGQVYNENGDKMKNKNKPVLLLFEVF